MPANQRRSTESDCLASIARLSSMIGDCSVCLDGVVLSMMVRIVQG